MNVIDCCRKCGKELTNDEIGLYKKMINRGATDYLCLECLCKRLEISNETALKKIEQFRENGCSLFAKKTN